MGFEPTMDFRHRINSPDFSTTKATEPYFSRYEGGRTLYGYSPPDRQSSTPAVMRRIVIIFVPPVRFELTTHTLKEYCSKDFSKPTELRGSFKQPIFQRTNIL